MEVSSVPTRNRLAKEQLWERWTAIGQSGGEGGQGREMDEARRNVKDRYFGASPFSSLPWLCRTSGLSTRRQSSKKKKPATSTAKTYLQPARAECSPQVPQVGR